MEEFDIRRNVLTQVVRDPEWLPHVASPEGYALKDLEAMGWVVLEVDGYRFRVHLTVRGLDRHRSWGDDRRRSRRCDVRDDAA